MTFLKSEWVPIGKMRCLRWHRFSLTHFLPAADLTVWDISYLRGTPAKVELWVAMKNPDSVVEISLHNLTFDLSSKLKFLLNTTGVLLEGRGVQENSFNSILGSALNFDPTVAVNNTVAGTPGQYGFSNLLLSEVFNPLTKLENTYNKNMGSKLYGKFELQYQLLNNLRVNFKIWLYQVRW